MSGSHFSSTTPIPSDTVLPVSSAQYYVKPELNIAYKTRNFYLNTTDGERLGAWHVLFVIPPNVTQADLKDLGRYISRRGSFPRFCHYLIKHS